MSRVRDKNTKPELLVRRFLHGQGFRYRLHVKDLPGKPDLVLPKYKTVIFVHGCFWHGHENCKKAALPQTRTEWWQNKIGSNKANDIKHSAALQKAGWTVLVVWECDLATTKINDTLNEIAQKLTSPVR